MPAAELKKALKNCLIDFDQRVLVTDLLEEFELPYEEVNKLLAEHLAEQEEQGVKYEKRFLVHGQLLNGENEIYTVVEGEAKLQEWLQKLKDAESSLYAVEVAGGAKAAAQEFDTMRRCALQLKSLEVRAGAGKLNGNATAAAVKLENKPEAKKTSGGASLLAKKIETSEVPAVSKKSDSEPSTASAERKKSPPDAKKPTPKTASKKGINSFFTPAASAAAAKAEQKKDGKATSNIKPPTPKKLQNFFKKQTEKPQTKDTNAEAVSAANSSIQLFVDDDEEEAPAELVESSDEEEKLEALRRDIITSDQENTTEQVAASGSKRRRISFSDDDEPQQKHEKKEEPEVEEVPAPVKSETFLDDDGFVITIKAKKPQTVAKTKKILPPSKKSPPKPKSAATPAASKTKQGNIMSFFAKK